MGHWLIKTEPETWSWAQQVAQGWTDWDGVRNYQARNNLRAMQVGDLAFFYHSVKERQIVGIVRVSKPYAPDPTDPSGQFGLVTVETVSPLKRPVSLAQIKAHPGLQDLALIKQSRLSVMPIDEIAWALILKMAENQ